jgi:hypothetical protein
MIGVGKIVRHNDQACPWLPCKCGEGGIDFHGLMNRRRDQPDRSRGNKRFESVQESWGNCFRVVDESNPSHGGRDFQEHLQPLADNRGFKSLKTGYVASGLGEVPDKAAAYGIEDVGEDDWYDPRFLKQRSTIDVYPEWNDANDTQSIIVATPAARPSADAVMQRAVALQEQHHFRYPLPDLVGERAQSAEGGEVMSDDFAPVNLYETMPSRPQKTDRLLRLLNRQ